MKAIFLLATLLMAVLSTARVTAADETAAKEGVLGSVASPGGKLAAEIALRAGEDGQERLCYRVLRGAAEDRKEVLGWSPLGIVREDVRFVEGLKLVRKGEIETIDEKYELCPTASGATCHAVARQQSFAFTAEGGTELGGRLPRGQRRPGASLPLSRRGQELHTVTEELTGFRIPADGPGVDGALFRGLDVDAGLRRVLREVAVGTASPKKAGLGVSGACSRWPTAPLGAC